MNLICQLVWKPQSATALDALRRAYSLARTALPSQRAFSQLMNEWRFEHVHHSTAIEGNPLSYQTVRAFLETRLVSGAPQLIDANLEVLGTVEAIVVNAS